jgi:hypothetical protein
MDTWHHEKNPNGITVEMHGNIRCAKFAGKPVSVLLHAWGHQLRLLQRNRDDSYHSEQQQSQLVVCSYCAAT